MITRLTDPFAALLDLQRAMGARRGAQWLLQEPGDAGAFPPINVFLQGEDYVAVAEIPGVHAEDITVEVHGNHVRIAGTRRPLYGEDVSVHRRERRSGRFDRTLTLPIDVDADAVRAECRDGLLAVLLPRAERERRRTVPVQ